MCSGRFRAYGVSPEGLGRAAVLRGYRLQFNKKSTKDGSGKANVEAYANSNVWGVLYSVPDADLDKLDTGEGGYRRTLLPVHVLDNSVFYASAYMASKPSDPDLRPYTWYTRFLIEGAREHVLPEDYVEGLEHLKAVQDNDQARDQRMRALACQDHA
jgi:gamma-glutamylcyclotransferase